MDALSVLPFLGLAFCFFGKALHRLSLNLIHSLDLGLGEKLGVFLVILLSDGENLLATVETLLNLLLVGGGSHAAEAWSQRPDFFLLLAENRHEFAGEFVVECQLVGYVTGLHLCQLLARHALFLSLRLCESRGTRCNHHECNHH